MKHLIHDAAGFKLELAILRNSITGPTIEIISTWPLANHPEPHRLLSLTLPPDSLRWLADAIERAAQEDDAQRAAASLPRSQDMTRASQDAIANSQGTCDD